jgi:hypothetical protein
LCLKVLESRVQSTSKSKQPHELKLHERCGRSYLGRRYFYHCEQLI